MAAGAESTDKQVADAAVREARDLLVRELLGHYDVDALEFVATEAAGRQGAEPDYGLVKAVVKFSAHRNQRRSRSLNREMFKPASAMCRDWLYLHCGVPPGHVFEGRIALLLALDRVGSWRAVSPHWRSRRLYPLHGYLLLDGREPEGYVSFPKAR